MQGGRKRYTVALGGPIVAPPEVEAEHERERSGLGTAFFSSAAESSDDYYDDDDESTADADETLGRKAASRAAAAVKLGSANAALIHDSSSRMRAQSTYGDFTNPLQSNQAFSAQSKHRFRSQSIDVRSDSTFCAEQTGKFVDPLVLRRQGKSERGKEKPLIGPGKKVPVGQLVAFFDSERKVN
jgi:hypothetical protein